jgi:hypothetical protein
LTPVKGCNPLGAPHEYARITHVINVNTRGVSIWDADELAIEAVTQAAEMAKRTDPNTREG